jgi:hypothetical protein
MNPYIRSWDIESSTSDKVYKVSQRADGSLACNCPAWKFHKAPKVDCRHCDAVRDLERDLENLRSGLKQNARNPLAMASGNQSQRFDYSNPVQLPKRLPAVTPAQAISTPAKPENILETFTIKRKFRDD